MSIGWLSGKSIINLAPALNTVQFTALLLVLVIVFFRLGTNWLSKRLTRSQAKNKR
jgi:hypothetical protein